MSSLDQYIIWGCILLLLGCVLCVFKWVRRKKALSGTRQFVMTALETALFQRTPFDIKLKDGSSRSGLSAMLEAISSDSLSMLVNGFVNEEWNRKEVEVFFRITQPEGPVFYVFTSSIVKLAPGPETSALAVAMPDHLRVEKKRHFIRVSPEPTDILMIAVWAATPGKRLPRSSADMGSPAVRWKNGEAKEGVRVENISGGGLALSIQTDEKGQLPFPSARGRQIICLLVYRPDPTAVKPLIFWCSGEIMSVRKSGSAVALGMEFTNWAIQAQGDSEIHWTHSSPWQGAKPILAWVNQIDKPRT